MPIGFAIFMLIVCTLMGTVFTFGMSHLNAEIAPEQALQISATYASHKEHFGKDGSRGIGIFFSDHEQLYIDGCCVDDDIRNALDNLSEKAKLKMLVHPNSDTILDMKAGSVKILDFDVAMQDLHSEAIGFLILGIVLYIGAAYAIYSLVAEFTRLHKLKHKKSRR